MTNKIMSDSPLLTFGLGVGAGATLLWAAVEFLPILLIGGGVWLIVKETTPIRPSRENINEVLDRTGNESPNKQSRSEY